MFILRNLFALAFLVSVTFIVQPANAVTISTPGVAVGAIGDDPGTQSVGVIGTGDNIGPGAIEFFIPLANGSSGTYGVGPGTGFGTEQDQGNGGGILTMILAFSPIDPTLVGTLNILFDDLDLIGTADTGTFLESIAVFDQSGATLISTTESAAAANITGDVNTQMLSLALGTLSGFVDTYYVQLEFTARLLNNKIGKNTAEYLIASIDQVPPIPIPAALPLFGTGLAIMGFIGWRRKRQSQA